MKRGTIFLVIFVLIVGALIAASQFIGNQPPIEVTIAVSPLAEDWARASADAFNDADQRINSTRRVQVNIIVEDDLNVWSRGGSAEWTTTDHPDGWIPASSMSIDYANSGNIPMETVTASTAKTLLVWGGYAERVNLLTDGSPLTWADVQRAADTASWSALGGQANWQFVNLAYGLSDQSISGFGVLLSGAAAFNETSIITGSSNSRNFRDWLEPVVEAVPNFNTIGGDVAQFVARGPSNADIGLAPESQWVQNLSGLTSSGDFVFSYPAYPVVFDFPVAAWTGVEPDTDLRAAVEAFGNWLLTGTQQASAAEFGLRAADGSVPPAAALFTAAEPFGIALTPAIDDPVQAPNASEANSLIQWFSTVRR